MQSIEQDSRHNSGDLPSLPVLQTTQSKQDINLQTEVANGLTG